MNWRKVEGKQFYTSCRKCGFKITNGQDQSMIVSNTIWADLDSAPFSYYCDICKRELNGEKATHFRGAS